MATNKNAIIRYKTIDKCLQNRQKRWTLDMLIEACSDTLYEYEGKHSNVSKRTVQLDIQYMRSDKLGYHAPIVVYHKKYYKYEDPNYSITDIPLSAGDMDILTESVEILNQFKDFSLFKELYGVIQKLEDKVYRETNFQSPIIHLEKNEDLKGLEHLDPIYQAILKRLAMQITYRSFSATEANQFPFFGYILKEYNNRWFVVGRKPQSHKILTLALDRIIKVGVDLSFDYEIQGFDPKNYYQHTIGVTVLNDKSIIEVELIIDPQNAPYVLTKPFHSSQKLLESYPDGRARISMRVHHNFELERLILGFGEAIQVLGPQSLRGRIAAKHTRAANNYNK